MTSSNLSAVSCPTLHPRVEETRNRDAQIEFQRRLQDVGLAVLFVSLSFVVFFWQLGASSFWDPDEAHYAETSREMVAAGDWWAPYYNEQPFFDKPVLFHQLQGAAMALLGPTEFAARLVPSVAGLGLVLVTFWFGCRIGSRDHGAVAALLLLASPGVFALSRYAILDTLFTFFLFGGAALLAIAALEVRRRLEWPGYIAIALAVMVKGPVALILIGLAFVVACSCSVHVRHRFFALRWMTGLGLVMLLTAPWFVYMFKRFGDAFLQGYVFDENFRLYTGRRFANQPNFYFYFRILAAGLLPWTGLLIGRLFDNVRALIKGEGLDHVEILLWSWTASIVGFFSLSTFKLDHYVFPAAPALSLLGARAWFDVRAARLSPRNAGARVGLHLIGPLVVAIGIGCGYFLIARLDLPAVAFSVPVALTIAGALLTGLANVRGGLPPRAPWIVLTALLITYAGLVGFLMPALERNKVVDDLARHAAAETDRTARLATYRLDRWNPAFRFYAGRHVTFLDNPADAKGFFEASDTFFCVMRRPAYDEFIAAGVPLRIIEERVGMWATSGRAVWRQSIPMTRFVLVTNGSTKH